MKAKLRGDHAEHARLSAQIAEIAEGSGSRPENAPGRADGIEVLIPSECVGALLGKGGSTIMALESESGAKIRLLPAEDAPDGGKFERSILLKGGDRAVDRAAALIEEKLAENAERDAKRGGKKLKRAAARAAERRRPPARTEEVAEFDATGQLVITTRTVRDEEGEAEPSRRGKPAGGGAVGGPGGGGGPGGVGGPSAAGGRGMLDDEPSHQRRENLQRYEGGERTRYFRDDDGRELNELVAEARRSKGGGAKEGSFDGAYARHVAKSKKFKGVTADDEYDYDEARSRRYLGGDLSAGISRLCISR